MKSKRALAVLALLGLAAGILIYHLLVPGPRVFSVSTSPDGDLRCVVMVQPPTGLMTSPYVYTFTIENAATRQSLTGEPLQVNNDSAVLNPLSFTWSANRVVVREAQSRYWNATVLNGEQHWERVSQAVTTTAAN